MNYTVTAYLLYLALGIGLTIWVARTLSRYGVAFLPETARQNAAFVEAVDRLLVVGFYLINFGCISFLLQTDAPIERPQGIFEVLSSKLGLVLLILGSMHFFIVAVLSALRRHTLRNTPPPIPPGAAPLPQNHNYDY